MTKQESLQLFEERKVRTAWDSNEEKWFFSIIDVVAVLTDSADYQTARNYWKVLKNRLTAEGNETVTKCNQFKMRAADGKMRKTDVADIAALGTHQTAVGVGVVKQAAGHLDDFGLADPHLTVSVAYADETPSPCISAHPFKVLICPTSICCLTATTAFSRWTKEPSIR